MSDDTEFAECDGDTDVVAQQFLKQLLNTADVKLTGASRAGVVLELFDVFREFFNDSSSWMENITFSVLPNTTVYALTPTIGQIVRLAGVVDGNSTPQPAFMPVLGTVTFRSAYTSVQQMTATVVLSVAFPTNSDHLPCLPSWVIPMYGAGLVEGLLGRMMAQSGQSWSNVKGSIYYLQRFRKTISDARVAALRRNAFGTQAWSYPQGFRTRTQKGGVSVGNSQSFQ